MVAMLPPAAARLMVAAPAALDVKRRAVSSSTSCVTPDWFRFRPSEPLGILCHVQAGGAGLQRGPVDGQQKGW